MDLDIVLECPNCGYEHCRVVKNGKITSDRWDQRNRTIYVSTATTSTTSTFTTYSSSTARNAFLYGKMNIEERLIDNGKAIN